MEELLIDDVKLRIGDEDNEVFTHYGNQDCAHGLHSNMSTYNKRGPKVSHKGSDSSDDVNMFSRVRTTSQSSDSDAVRPLMYPRQRVKKIQREKKFRFMRFVRPALGFIILIGVLVAIALVVIRVVDDYSSNWLPGQQSVTDRVIGCSHIEADDVWVKGFPKLMTESAFRLLDVTGDGILDILFGFATGAEGYNVPDLVCDIYFQGQHPCLGGVLAVDGRTGGEVWRHYTPHEVFAISCEEDLNLDGHKDCIVAGRVGGFEAIDSQSGTQLWNYTHSSDKVDIMNLYTGQYIGDIDGDRVTDLLNIHGGDPFGEPGSETRLSGKLVLFSGKTGHILQSMGVPDGRESYYSPVIYAQADGTRVVLFGTGGETHPGALWFVTLQDLIKGDISKATRIYSNPFKGIMTPPVLLDLTKDGVDDIIMATYNSTLIAFDGNSLEQLWNFTYPSSETYATPSPGFFNDDDVPDFMVHWQSGPGFPVYYHAVTTVVDGSTGVPLVSPYIRSSVGAQTSPLTVSVEGLGNDIFLHWLADCINHEAQGGQYGFVKGTNVHEKSRSDVCRLRFKSEGFSRLVALSSHTKSPGTVIYDSEKRKITEHSAWVNTTREAELFLERNPEYRENYEQWKDWVKKNQAKAEKILGTDTANSADDLSQSRGRYDQFEDHYDNEDNNMDAPVYDYNDAYKTLTDMLGSQNLDPELYSQVSDLLSDYYKSKNNRYTEDEPSLVPDQYRAEKPSLMRNRYRGGQADRFDDRFGSRRDDLLGNNFQSNPINLQNRYDAQKLNNLRNNYGTPKSTSWQNRFGPDRSNLMRSKYGTYGNYGEGGRYNNENSRNRQNEYGQPNTPERTQGAYNFPFRQHSREQEVSGASLGKNLKRKPTWSTRSGQSSRRKRHVGIHDEGGLQRLISTGTLAPTLLPPSDPAYNHSVDVVFATYWFYPAKTKVLLPQDQLCIDSKMKEEEQRFDPKSKYYGMDDDGYEHAVTDECLEKSRHQLSEHGVYQSQDTYNPYTLHMGQLTLYRIRLKCTCPGLVRSKGRCGRVLPYEEQQWPAYMGRHADSHWIPRHH